MAKQSGVGFRLPAGSVAVWRSPGGAVPSETYRINFAFELEPDDRSFRAGLGEGSPDFLGRYAGGTSQRMSTRGLYGQGWWGELIGNNEVALIAWHSEQSEAHRAAWNGQPTPQEIYDYALTVPRRALPAPPPPRPPEPPPPPPPPTEERPNRSELIFEIANLRSEVAILRARLASFPRLPDHQLETAELAESWIPRINWWRGRRVAALAAGIARIKLWQDVQ